MDLLRPTRTLSLEGRKYDFVIVDDYSRNIWVYFLTHKHKSFKFFEIFYTRVKNEKGFGISSIRNDHGNEFETTEFRSFYEKNGISITFLH